MKIYGFYHIAAINDYETLVLKQLDRLLKSGLLSVTKILYIISIGNKDSYEKILGIINRLKITNIKILSVTDLTNYEFITLKTIKKLSEKEDFNCYYLHTKGVSISENNYSFYSGGKYDYNHVKECVETWREYMEYFIIDNYYKCIEGLKEFDAVGCFKTNNPQNHFTGNFWWSKSDYIKKLTSIDSLNTKDRYQAEFWIGGNNIGKLLSLHQPENEYKAYVKKCDFDYKLKKTNVDIVIISDSKNAKLTYITENTLKTLYQSDKNINFITYVVESSDVDYTYINKNITMVKPEKPFGYNKYLNLGRKLGNSKYVCLCNNDLEFKKDWCTKIIKEMVVDPNLMSASPFSYNPHIEVFNIKEKNNLYGYSVPSRVSGWCLFQQRDIYDIIGDLDENFIFWYADNDYSKTIEKLNIKHALICDSEVNHITSSTLEMKDDLEKFNLTQKQKIIFDKKWG